MGFEFGIFHIRLEKHQDLIKHMILTFLVFFSALEWISGF